MTSPRHSTKTESQRQMQVSHWPSARGLPDKYLLRKHAAFSLLLHPPASALGAQVVAFFVSRDPTASQAMKDIFCEDGISFLEPTFFPLSLSHTRPVVSIIQSVVTVRATSAVHLDSNACAHLDVTRGGMQRRQHRRRLILLQAAKQRQVLTQGHRKCGPLLRQW